MRRPRVGPLLEEGWKIDVAGIELCVMFARLCHLTAWGRRPLQRKKEEVVEVGLNSSRWQKSGRDRDAGGWKELALAEANAVPRGERRTGAVLDSLRPP